MVLRAAFAALVAALLGIAAPALAAPTFPPLTGRVVDDAHVLDAATKAELTTKLEDLEQRTSRQLVVVTVPSLQGYEIEDYGYQLGRAWGIGQKKLNNGALFIVAPSEHAVRIEVGYGLEPILTDALSSVILQEAVIPKFKQGDVQGGIVAGTNEIVKQLTLDAPAAKARVAAARQRGKEIHINPVLILFIIFFVFSIFGRIFRGARRTGGMGSAWWLLPLILSSGRGRSSGWGGGSSGGGGSWGGGGFSGGGGSFGGGGASGHW
jgi:uncharacterized protein